MNNIVIQHLYKNYGGKTVLSDLNAVFHGGQTTCIMGPSGCGKTTLLNLLLGLEKPDGGFISGMPKKKAVVFQEDRLCDSLTVRINLRMVMGRKARDQEIRDCLSQLEIADTMYETVSNLSGGMKRRVAIARALLAKGDILIMDEPFKGLDEAMRAKTIQTIQRCGSTILMVTHDPEEARMMNAKIFRLPVIRSESLQETEQQL